MLNRIAALLAPVSCLLLASCVAAVTVPVPAPVLPMVTSATPTAYRLLQGAWTCQDPEVIEQVEKGIRSGHPDPDLIQQHRCTLNPVNWPAHVMRVDGGGRYVYVCDAFSKCTGEAVFCQYALSSELLDTGNRSPDPAALRADARHTSLQDLLPNQKAECTVSGSGS